MYLFVYISHVKRLNETLNQKVKVIIKNEKGRIYRYSCELMNRMHCLPNMNINK